MSSSGRGVVPVLAGAPTGRLGVLTAASVVAFAIPLPFVPDRIVGRLRGAIAHDAAARHGVSLTPDARKVLAEVDSEHGGRAMARKAAEMFGIALLKRGLGPLSALANVARGLEVYAFGHLFDRYLANARRSGAVRIHAEEARRIRELIDRAMLHSFSPTLSLPSVTMQDAVEDLRDDLTRWIDSAILTGASLPSYVERRLDAAFDDLDRVSQGSADG